MHSAACDSQGNCVIAVCNADDWFGFAKLKKKINQQKQKMREHLIMNDLYTPRSFLLIELIFQKDM